MARIRRTVVALTLLVAFATAQQLRGEGAAVTLYSPSPLDGPPGPRLTIRLKTDRTPGADEDYRTAGLISLLRSDYIETISTDVVSDSDDELRWWVKLNPQQEDAIAPTNYVAVANIVSERLDRATIRADILLTREMQEALKSPLDELFARRLTGSPSSYSISYRRAGQAGFGRFELDVVPFIWGYRATEDLTAGTQLADRMVERVPVTSQPGVVARDLRFYSVVGPVKAGSVLVASSLRKTPLVHSGDEIDLDVRKGSVQVRIGGTSWSEGGIGDAVSVRIGLTGRLVSGFVSDFRTVYVELD